MNKEDSLLIAWYYRGHEYSADDRAFPKWFPSESEKIACLLGYNDFDTNCVKEEKEILEEIKRILK